MVTDSFCDAFYFFSDALYEIYHFFQKKRCAENNHDYEMVDPVLDESGMGKGEWELDHSLVDGGAGIRERVLTLTGAHVMACVSSFDDDSGDQQFVF